MADVLTLGLVASIAGVFGLLVGSFLNVVVSRVPAGLSVVTPRSRCPQCESSIAVRDNIPIASWIVLRGRCRNCGTAISPLYPAVEAITAVAFATVALVAAPPVLEASNPASSVGHAVFLIGLLWFAAASVALTIIDLQTHRLPNAIVYPTAGVAVVSAAGLALAEGDLAVLIRAGLGALILFGFYLALGLAWKGGMGFGDIKLAAVVGTVLGALGWGALVVGAFAAFVLGGMVSVILIASRLATRKSGIPFGPWMLAGAWVGIAAGNDIANAYLALVGLT